MNRNLRMFFRAWKTCLLITGVLVSSATSLRAADHRDGPRITDLNNTVAGALDLNDLYIFVSPQNHNNTVFIQTMSPGAGIVGPAGFLQGAIYELRISNDGNPITDEIVFQTSFSPPNSAGIQSFAVGRFDANGGRIVASGFTNGSSVNIQGGGKATAGIFDDPFFFDVNATANFNREATLASLGLPITPTPTGSPARFFLRPNFPNNFFGGFNTLAIVFEVPSSSIQSSRSNPNISAWIRSAADLGDGRGFAQFDRTAIPSINTVVVPLSRTNQGQVLPNGLQDQFNFLTPSDDVNNPAIRAAALNRLMTVFGLTATQAAGVADFGLPDVAKFNTTSKAGFPNGRRLPDDVIDTELGLLTNGALATDRVNNDSYFRSTFPYIGLPNPVTQTIAVKAARMIQQP